MSRIQVKDKHFVLSISEKNIIEAIERIAQQMNAELKEDNPLFICVLNGAFMFASDLLKRLNFPCEVTFIRLKSYKGTSSKGKITEIYGLVENVKGRNIVVIEDIIDTGHTIENLKNHLLSKEAKSVRIAALLLKPDTLLKDVKPDYVGIKILPDFIVGYGLDYDGYGRNLKNIYRLES